MRPRRNRACDCNFRPNPLIDAARLSFWGSSSSELMVFWVFAIAISETDIYVGGSFTDVNNNGTMLPEADFIARYGSNAYEIYLPVTTNNNGGQ